MLIMTTPKTFKRQNALTVEYRTPREGPPSFLIWEPGKSYICMDRASLLKAVKWPKYTATGTELRNWLDALLPTPNEPTPEQAEGS